MIERVLLAAVVLIAVGGAIGDLRNRIISNWLCLALGLASIGYALAFGGLDYLGSSALHASIALLVGMGLFAVGAMGGGDAKFYTGAAFSVALDKALEMFVITAFSGLVLLVVLIVYRRLIVRRNDSAEELRKAELPYGVAIASGLILTHAIS